LSCYSQSRQLLSVYINAGAFAGNQNGGLHTGIDLEARNNKFGLFLNGAVNVNNEKSIIEISVGPRWYIGNTTKVSGTIEPAFGFYRRGFERSGGGNLGINFGGGINYVLSVKTELGLKAKYHLLGAYFGDSYGDIYIGLRYYFNK